MSAGQITRKRMAEILLDDLRKGLGGENTKRLKPSEVDVKTELPDDYPEYPTLMDLDPELAEKARKMAKLTTYYNWCAEGILGSDDEEENSDSESELEFESSDPESDSNVEVDSEYECECRFKGGPFYQLLYPSETSAEIETTETQSASETSTDDEEFYRNYFSW